MRTLLIILIIYFAIRMTRSVWLPWLKRLVNYAIIKLVEKRFGVKAPKPPKRKKEGEVEIVNSEKYPKSNSDKKTGEYIDYEEVK